MPGIRRGKVCRSWVRSAPVRAMLAVLVISSFAWSSTPLRPARAQACLSDLEPSETPVQAMPISGAVCIDATMPEGDQDLFRWTVGEDEGVKRWTLTLTGIPTTQTLLQLRRVDSPPDATSVQLGNPLVELAVQPQVTEPSVAGDLLVPPGDYVVAVGRGGVLSGLTETSSAYGLTIAPGSALPQVGDVEPNDGPDQATAVKGAFAISGDLEVSN